MKNSNRCWLIAIVVLAAFLRFYKLDWGSGYFFHPDEYHIAASVNQLQWPSQMNPHFFAYGTFTSYLIYFTKLFFPWLFGNLGGFGQAILIGRGYSAFFATLTVLIVYQLVKDISGRTSAGRWSALLVATTPGLIQQAHFTTPESMLIFWLMATLWCLVRLIISQKIRYFLLASVCLGFGAAVKISSWWMAPIWLISISGYIFGQKKIKLLARAGRLIGWLIIGSLLAGLSFFITYPYAILDWTAWQGTLRYELCVAGGSLPVFYTRQFIATTPFLFQVQKIYPYALGWPVLLAGTAFFIYLLVNLKRYRFWPIILILMSFLSFFIPTGLLFAKWTRFSAPVFPFFGITGGLAIDRLSYFLAKTNRRLALAGQGLMVLVFLVPSLVFLAIYLREDVRLIATSWLNKNLPSQSTVLIEGGNMLDIPLYGAKVNRISFDFYNLETNLANQQQLMVHLASSDYFIVQSRRVFANHLRLSKEYPFTAHFYQQLFDGSLGFREVKDFTSYPGLDLGPWHWEIPDEQAEETWSVFDHPVIRVYQKVQPKTEQQYQELLKYKSNDGQGK